MPIQGLGSRINHDFNTSPTPSNPRKRDRVEAEIVEKSTEIFKKARNDRAEVHSLSKEQIQLLEDALNANNHRDSENYDWSDYDSVLEAEGKKFGWAEMRKSYQKYLKRLNEGRGDPSDPSYWAF